MPLFQIHSLNCFNRIININGGIIFCLIKQYIDRLLIMFVFLFGVVSNVVNSCRQIKPSILHEYIHLDMDMGQELEYNYMLYINVCYVQTV